MVLQPEWPGVITWEVVEAALTERTRLVSLATCNYLSGYRVGVEEIGRNLQERGIRFCLDGIQTVGAYPISLEHVDFLSADSHKWMLGPVGAGIFYVKKERFEELEPTLLGAWNVESPEFIAQESIAYYPGGRRYEPGTLNLPGIMGMRASIDLLLDVGVEAVAERILALRSHFLDRVRPLGYRLWLEEWDQGPDASDATRSSIMSLTPSTSLRRTWGGRDLGDVFERLSDNGVRASLRENRAGEPFLLIFITRRRSWSVSWGCSDPKLETGDLKPEQEIE